jgi:hypothetical protein
MTKIDEKTTLPIQWVIVGAYVGGGAILASLIVACSWVFTVNARLMRIEQKLGISQPVATDGIVRGAYANEK